MNVCSLTSSARARKLPLARVMDLGVITQDQCDVADKSARSIEANYTAKELSLRDAFELVTVSEALLLLSQPFDSARLMLLCCLLKRCLDL